MNTAPSTNKIPLVRLDDDCWSYPLSLKQVPENKRTFFTREQIEARIHADRFESVCATATLIQRLGIETLLKQETYFEFPKIRTLKGRWKVSIQPPEWGFLHSLKQYIPFFHQIAEKNTLNFTVQQLENAKGQLIFDFLVGRKIFTPAEAISEEEVPQMPRKPIEENLSLETLLHTKPFGDPFTKVATQAFQCWNKHFVPTDSPLDNTQMVIEDGVVVLEPLCGNGEPTTLEAERKNRHTVQTFKKFMEREYGSRFIEYIQHRFSFDLDALIETGMPLLPEHVWKCNIGVNNHEAHDLEYLWTKLKKLSEDLVHHKPRTTLNHVFATYLENPERSPLSLRAMKGLCRALPGYTATTLPTAGELQTFLKKLLATGAQKAEDLDPERFDTLLSILRIPREFEERIYTGRKIVHLPIMGYYTMADKTLFKPALDQQEALQVYPDLEKQEDWENFHELLAHVIVKKHFVRSHHEEKWRVGALLPGPTDLNNKPRWYRVESCTDDNNGDFNYTLVPACQDKTLPHIKLYRSTCSDPYHMNGKVSMLADLRPFAGPGRGRTSLSSEYELPFFKNRSIPLWVGYLLAGKQQLAELHAAPKTQGQLPLAKQFKEALEASRQWNQLLESLKTGVACLYKQLLKEKYGTLEEKIFFQLESDLALLGKIEPEEILNVISQENVNALREKRDQAEKTIENYLKLLEEYGHKHKELPQYKIDADVAFVGHSLGAALSQQGIAYFSAEQERIPLPGKNFSCWGFCPPGVTHYEKRLFMNYGNAQVELSKRLGHSWSIKLFHECGDVVSLGGSQHLGGTDADPNSYAPWLNVQILYRKPLDTAEHKDIIGASTHGRRWALAIVGRDYIEHSVTPAFQHEADNSFFPGQQLRKIQGYRWMHTALIAETFRKLNSPFGELGFIIKAINDTLTPPTGAEMRDKNNIFHCVYQG